MFAEAEAARLLQLHQSTLHYWLEGREMRGRHYQPIIRPAATGSRIVTWAEFIEAGLLRSYRSKRVPMAELRAFIDLLRQEYGVPYPLAHEAPLVSGRQLVLQAQEQAGLDGDFCLVAFADNKLILTGPSLDFTERVHWENDIAVQWRPHDDPHSPVLMTPDVRFGRPAVHGISTDVIWEHDEAGEDVARLPLPSTSHQTMSAGLWRTRRPCVLRWRERVRRASLRPATVRFYVDADVLGLAKILVEVRADVTYLGDPGGDLFKRHREACPITSPATLDPEWTPEVTRRGWLIITRDRNIAVNRAEIAAVRDNGARMVALAGREAIGTWAQLEVLLTQWRRVEALLSESGPFIYSATRTSFRPVDLT